MHVSRMVAYYGSDNPVVAAINTGCSLIIPVGYIADKYVAWVTAIIGFHELVNRQTTD